MNLIKLWVVEFFKVLLFFTAITIVTFIFIVLPAYFLDNHTTLNGFEKFGTLTMIVIMLITTTKVIMDNG